MSVSLEELKKNNSGNNYEKGYRIVYFMIIISKVGEYCKTIDGFMITLLNVIQLLMMMFPSSFQQMIYFIGI